MKRLVVITATTAMIVCGVLIAGVADAPVAFGLTGAPRWTVTAVSEPTVFKPGEDLYRIVVTNTGGAASNGKPVQISDELPEGVSLAASGASGEDQLALQSSRPPGQYFKCVLSTCTYEGAVVPEQELIVTVPVSVGQGAPSSSVMNVVRVSGGGAPDVSRSVPTSISESEEAGFGIAPGGSMTSLSSMQAGAHPDITTTIAFDTISTQGSLAGQPKDLITEEPSGFAGDLVDTPTCAPSLFEQGECPIATQIGTVTLMLLVLSESKPTVFVQPVYNLVPNPGEVAKFGFAADNIYIQGNVSVRPGDYGLRVAFHNTNQTLAELDAVTLTVWGVPASPLHDTWRVDHGYLGARSEVSLAPYFTNPTACGASLEATFDAVSWQGATASAGMPFGSIVGCDRLGMPASFLAEPTSENAGAASGLNVDLGVSQTYENAEGLASSTLNKAVVTLPEGMTINPSAGAGLVSCSMTQYAEEGVEPAAGHGCPNESKLGTVLIETPALREKGEGSVFLAEPAPRGETGKNPFNTLLVLYVVARFPQRGVLVKVAGRVSADPVTGRLVTTFERQPDLEPLPDGTSQPGLDGLPPVPFTSFVFKFHQGATSPLVTPPVCGSYTASVALSPWAEPLETLIPELHPFSITHGVDGTACPTGAPPLHPQAISGTLDNNGGSFSPFYLRLVREDGEQEITRFSTILPPGLTGDLTGIPFCPDASIEAARDHTGAQEENQPSCPTASLLGHTLVGAGVGSVLAQAPGKIYLAGPYHGAPLSLVSITSAKVGPFDLGTVVIRFALQINPVTAQVEVSPTGSEPIPHIIKGIVVHVRDIRAYVDRPNFIINPTSCEHMAIQNTITGAGADPANPADQVPVSVTSPFQATDCQSLAFNPAFTVFTSGKTSKANGASLSVKLTMPGALGSNANIHQVKVELPVQLPSRLTTLQKACTKAQFDANPAGCPAASVVGRARAITPILPVPLEGPAYFVSNGGEAFPNLIIVLQGYGVTIDLVGDTFISKQGITSSTFKTVPDQPVASFELTLPQGPFSALTANTDLCALTKTVSVKKKVTLRSKNGRKRTVTRKIKQTAPTSLSMPTEFVAQNGAVIHQATPIAVTGCPKVLPAKTKAKKTKARRKGKKG